MEEDRQIIVLMGISGSGKSTFKNRLKENLPDSFVISMDEMRKDITDINDQSFNAMVANKAKDLLVKSFSEKKNIIWDNTTLQIKYMKDLFQKKPAGYIFKVFYTERSNNPEACKRSIKEDLEKKEVRSAVPDEVVDRQYQNFKTILEWLRTDAPEEIRRNTYPIKEF